MLKRYILLLVILFQSSTSYSITPVSAVSRDGFADIVEPLMSAVVNVYTVQYPTNNKKQKRLNPFGNLQDHAQDSGKDQGQDSFSKFFEDFDFPLGLDEIYTDPEAMSLGSGIIISPEGYIVTNHHVIENEYEVKVKLSDNTELSAKIIGSDQRTDIALLKIESKKPLSYVKFGDSSKARVGDWVIAIGNPFGFGGTVTAGIISSKGRDIPTDTMGIVDDFIQTDAAINSGNSGGPMFNMKGEVIGINTAIFSPSGGNIGIGLAIPSATASKVVEQLKKHGKVSRGMLNIKVQEMTPEIADAMDMKGFEGVLVMETGKGGTGEKAGLKTGDIIVKIGNLDIKNARKLRIAVAATPINTETVITIIRDGKKQELTCRITETDRDRKILASSHQEQETTTKIETSLETHGVIFRNINENWLGTSSMPSAGTIVEQVKPNSSWKGLIRGDLILSINQMPVDSVDDILKIIKMASANNKKHIILFVKRYNTASFVLTLPL